jgi:hypothetical protein
MYFTGVFLSVPMKVKDTVPESKMFRKEIVWDIVRRGTS